MKPIILSLLLALLTLGIAHAEEEQENALIEQLEEAEGQPMDTLQEAMDALELRNDLLGVLLEKEELTDDDLAIIQQLTDTIENALAKIDEEVDTMKGQVQEVSEGADGQDQQRVRESGKDYLERINTLMQ
ncbi:DUF6746 family protein [Billgrantia montanilacus]|uniref:Uncharacterized protein n=1 Tax=Billgrantia montanilacus TaxID=2282305 RepID=A0A368U0L0_9GAMM|nr:DUF6746 family protein [Halomonas montanilacus]RCV88633.1 hypothetical protein DU505_13250 [Halomonas montanilacus]